MPGRLDALEGPLGKRKRVESNTEGNGFDRKPKIHPIHKPDHHNISLDTSLSDMHTFTYSPPNHYTSHPSKTRRKLAHPRPRPLISSHAAPSKPLAPSTTIQTPCHRCHKSPLTKTSLSSFTDCARCTERTCLVCLRQCGCRRKICADCSVEEGMEGDVYCLECFAKIQGGDGVGCERIGDDGDGGGQRLEGLEEGLGDGDREMDG